MLTNHFVVTQEALKSASAFVPTERLGAFAIHLLGLDGVSTATHSIPCVGVAVKNIANEEEVEEEEVEEDEYDSEGEDEYPVSYPITVDQALELRTQIGETSWKIISAALENTVDGVATIDWAVVKSLSGVSNWPQFAQGRLSVINKALRKIVGYNEAWLLIDSDAWVEDGKGDYSAGLLFIDGQAVQSLTAANV